MGPYYVLIEAYDNGWRDKQVRIELADPAGGMSGATIYRIDLAVDSDNDGQLAGDEPDDDPIEMNLAGKIIGVNDDNDDGPPAGSDSEIDNSNDKVDGDADKQDMAELRLRRIGLCWNDPNGKLTLYVSDYDREEIRIFDQNDHPIIGPGLPSSYEVPKSELLTGDLMYHIEGVKSGIATITLKYTVCNGFLDPGEDMNGNGVLDPGEDTYQEVCRDEVKITVVKLDLDVDTNRDGAIGDVADEDGEDNWTKTRGAIFNVNHDKDCDNLFGWGCPESDTVVFNDDGDPVNEDFTINGAGDCEDITPFVIRGLGVLPPNARLFLKAAETEDIKSIHIFKQIVADETSIWGGVNESTTEKDITDGCIPR